MGAKPGNGVRLMTRIMPRSETQRRREIAGVRFCGLKSCKTELTGQYVSKLFCSHFCRVRAKLELHGGWAKVEFGRGCRWIKQNGLYFRLELRTPRSEKCENPFCQNPNPQFEHCHVFLYHRGWLCNGCNVAIARVKDNPDSLRWLATYLETR